MKSMNIHLAFATLALLLPLTNAAFQEVYKRGPKNKRSFKSYFENYLDEMATSACAGMATKTGVYMGVRRACKFGVTCDHICKSLKVTGKLPSGARHSVCVESFHVYKHQPSLAVNKNKDTDVNKIGQAIHLYGSCHSNHCGPNYCCCRGY